MFICLCVRMPGKLPVTGNLSKKERIEKSVYE